MRAALLPSPGDPFLLSYWLRNFATWRSEVDRLYVLVNGQTDPIILDYLRAKVEAVGGWFRSVPKLLGHGEALDVLVEAAHAKYLLLCEEDAYVRHPGEIDKRFSAIESGNPDVIGSPRGSASMEIIERARELFGDETFVDSDEAGHALWPCFLFVKRADLRATDRQYHASLWEAGDNVPGLDLIADKQLSADTFGSTTYQLRAAKKRIRWESQFRAASKPHMDGWRLRFDPPWFHVGSLSTGYGEMFAGSRPARQILSLPALYDPAYLPVRDEWVRRLSWWYRFERTADDELPEVRARYRDGLDGIREILAEPITVPLLDNLIAGWDEAYSFWVTWREAA